MPNRVLREGFLDSEPLRQAGELAEALFTRLMLVADDFGRFDGRVTVICRRCWPAGGPAEDDVGSRLAALEQNGLVIFYEVDGKPFIYIPKFKQRTRQERSKYPDPPDEQPTSVARPSVTCPSRDSQPRTKTETETIFEDGGANARARAAPPPEKPKPQHPPVTLDEARISGPQVDDTPAAVLSAICVANRVTPATPFYPLIVEWAREGVTVDKLKNAIAIARHPDRKGPDGKISPAYLDPILKDTRKPNERGWKDDEGRAVAKGREVGVAPRPGEGMPAFVRRVDEAIAERARSAVR